MTQDVLTQSYVRDLRRRFTWRRDAGGDSWRILRDLDGPLVGDCEDYALTLAWILAGRSVWGLWRDVLLLRSVVWFCVTEGGQGHAMLWRRGLGWSDNIWRGWSPAPRHRRRFPLLAPLLAVKFGQAAALRLRARLRGK